MRVKQTAKRIHILVIQAAVPRNSLPTFLPSADWRDLNFATDLFSFHFQNGEKYECVKTLLIFIVVTR